MGITVTELLLGHVVDAMHVSWTDIRDMLRSFPLLVTLRLGGIPCADVPDYIPTKIPFGRLTYLDFVFSDASMIDVLASISTPALRMIHLDALSPEFIYHFITKCSHILCIPLRLSVKLADSFPPERITAVLNAFISVNQLDIRRQGARGEKAVTDVLMSGSLLLDYLEKLRVEWPIPDATLQIMFAINSFPGCSTITYGLTADPGSSIRTVAWRNGLLVEVNENHE
jgi:hypothetical protein